MKLLNNLCRALRDYDNNQFTGWGGTSCDMDPRRRQFSVNSH